MIRLPRQEYEILILCSLIPKGCKKHTMLPFLFSPRALCLLHMEGEKGQLCVSVRRE